MQNLLDIFENVTAQGFRFHLPRSRAAPPPAIIPFKLTVADMPFAPFVDAMAVVFAGVSRLMTGDVALLFGGEPVRVNFGILLGRVGDKVGGRVDGDMEEWLRTGMDERCLTVGSLVEREGEGGNDGFCNGRGSINGSLVSWSLGRTRSGELFAGI
jgi:hypothetical protein